MKQHRPELNKRAIVFQGGGAKGFYEAGVVHALHWSGMSFDIVTGSSVGAIVALLFAEYQFHKRCPDKDQQWLYEFLTQAIEQFSKLPEKNIISDEPPKDKQAGGNDISGDDGLANDDESGSALFRLMNDLADFDVSVGDLVKILWAATSRKPFLSFVYPSAKPVFALYKLGDELSERFGDSKQGLAKIVKLASGFGDAANKRPAELKKNLTDLLSHYFNQPKIRLGHALVDERGENAFRSLFLEQVCVGGKMTALIPPDRKLGDYRAAGIEVQFTRTNYRSGRLELSACVSDEEFQEFLQKKVTSWLQEKVPNSDFASVRFKFPGNPNALEAAIASGRFPIVFEPIPIERIYPEKGTIDSLVPALQAVKDEATRNGYSIDNERYEIIKNSLPRANDRYVDGGAIDNLPTNTAIDIARSQLSSELTKMLDHSPETRARGGLELFIVLLAPEPIPQEENKAEDSEAQSTANQLKSELQPQPATAPEDYSAFDVGLRTLDIMRDGKPLTDAHIVDVINKFGDRAHELGELVEDLLGSIHDLPEETRIKVLNGLAKKRQRRGQESVNTNSRSGRRLMISPMSASRNVADVRKEIRSFMIKELPIHVKQVEIYPEEMAMSTTQLTYRFGYDHENARKMLTMGCYTTLLTIYTTLRAGKAAPDEQFAYCDADKIAGQLAKLGLDPDKEPVDLNKWVCPNSQCKYREFCARRG